MSLHTNGHVIIPPTDELATMTDTELADMRNQVDDSIASCLSAIKRVGATHGNTDGIQAALKVYRRGAEAIDRIVRARHGLPPVLEAAKPVQSFVSAYLALKAVNRLLGLLQAEHEAVAVWLNPVAAGTVDDEAAAWDRLEAAHAAVAEALKVGDE